MISSSSSGRASATTSTIVLVGKFDPKTSRAFVDIAWFRPVGGEHVQRDDIVDRAAGGFDGALNLPRHKTVYAFESPTPPTLLMVRSGLSAAGSGEKFNVLDFTVLSERKCESKAERRVDR